MISLKNKKLIIFDLDGTIINLIVNWSHLKQLLSERILTLYGEKCDFNHISACLDHIVEKDDEKELQNSFKIIENYEMKNINLSEEIKETVFFINNLKLFGVPKETKLAVFSLNTRKAIIASLKLIKIYNKFEYIVGREDVRKWKPNPEGLFKIQSYFRIEKEKMIYFGDLQKDLKTGKNADIESYLIDDIIKLVDRKRQELKKK